MSRWSLSRWCMSSSHMSLVASATAGRQSCHHMCKLLCRMTFIHSKNCKQQAGHATCWVKQWTSKAQGAICIRLLWCLSPLMTKLWEWQCRCQQHLQAWPWQYGQRSAGARSEMQAWPQQTASHLRRCLTALDNSAETSQGCLGSGLQHLKSVRISFGTL